MSYKIIIPFLVVLIVFSGVGAAYLWNQNSKNNKDTVSGKNAETLKNMPNTDGSESISIDDLTDAKSYIGKTLKPEFVFGVRAFRIFSTTDNERVYKSLTWNKNNAYISFQARFSLQGKTYKKSGLPLNSEIEVRGIIDKGLSDEGKLRMLNQFFISDKILDAKNFNKFILEHEVGVMDTYEIRPDNTIDKDKTQLITIKEGAQVMEYVWDNTDGTLESRSILQDVNSPTAYFFACKIFPSSSTFPKRTCYE